MKKANTLHRLTGAHIAILMEYNGGIFLYQSDNCFASALKSIPAKQYFGPDHFDTVADRSSGNQNPFTLNQPPSIPVDVTPLLSSTSSTFTSSTMDSLPLQVHHESLDFSMPTLDPYTKTRYKNRAATNGNPKPEAVSLEVHKGEQRYYPLAVDFFG